MFVCFLTVINGGWIETAPGREEIEKGRTI